MNVILPVKSVWRSAQLLIAFHKTRQRRRRSAPLLWRPNNATARLHDDSEDREAFLVLKGDGQARDVQIRIRPDKLVLRRSSESMGWSGVVADHHSVSVKVGGTWIAIEADGSVKRESENGTTWLEADGAIVKLGGGAEILVSGDGSQLTRRTDDRLDAIIEGGVVSRAR
ncbi:hypothetical protein [Roseitranquillus sediminis]|uniref:hypothetical protein n=1 Tax=Roseitranquillus sediminis TaxID=2809051 RepID=UPI001D0C2C25|nr:hypothetical protein [Roseitranquillus sediminis]MBM9595085.1 hypothetical protein [Roseitranquillus sediminis]